MPVCLVCDCFIIGTERVHRMAKKTIQKYKSALSVHSYQVFHYEILNQKLVTQYRVKGLGGMLLSPSAGRTKKGYSVCSSCYCSPKNQNLQRQNLPSTRLQMDLLLGLPQMHTRSRWKRQMPYAQNRC